LAALLVPAAAQSQTTWQAKVGAQSVDKGRQVLAFLPNEMWIHVGDSVSWNVVTDEPHTITFLKAGQVRPPFQVGCPGFAAGTASFDGSQCISTGELLAGQSFTVSFPSAGNFKLVCLVHSNMTASIHVLDWTQSLPHTQGFYDDQSADQRLVLLASPDLSPGFANLVPPANNEIVTGVGEAVATTGGALSVSVMRFMQHDVTIHAGATLEWDNTDPVTPHTITFGVEPANSKLPSANVTLDADGARHAIINATTDSVNSGFISAAPQDQIGLPQTPIGVTRFRITFTHPGVYPYICALHDQLGMKGQVTVLP
jgi:plastocyanin